MSIADELLELQANATALDTARTDIRSALTAKGVSASDHDFADFAQDIGGISASQSVIIASKCGANATVTATLSGTTLTETADNNGIATFWVDTQGTYAISSTGALQSASVNVSAMQVIYNVALSPVPIGYTELEYLTFSSGGAYIDTGVKMTTTKDVGYKVKYSQYTSYHHLFVVGTNNWVSYTAPRRPSNGVVASGYRYENVTFTPTPTSELASIGNAFIVDTDYQNDKIIMNGVDYAVTPSLSGQTLPDNLNLIFGTYNSQLNRDFQFLGDVYYFYIKNNGVFTNYYVPCKRDSDNQKGFYETVSGNFVIPTGTFS